MELLSLPLLMIENIFSFLSFDEIARARIVCKDLDLVCQRLLNRGFIMIERRHAGSLKNVKSRLPRRESERRLHRLSRHCDILSAIETRISMLNMTYSKYIESKICCFIPGKVIDEIKRVLDIVDKNDTPPRAHEVLQELRDISSMAIEHFDDRICPDLRKKLNPDSNMAQRQMDNHMHSVHSECVAVEMLEGQPTPLFCLQRRTAANARLAIILAQQYTKMTKRMMMYRRVAGRQRENIRTLTAKVNEQGAAIAELKKRVDECDIKYSELTHTNQAVGGKAIAATSGAGDAVAAAVGGAGATGGTAAAGGAPLRNFASQIKLDLSHLPIGTGKSSQGKATQNMKPRKPVIRLPSISEEDTGEPRAKQPRIEPSPSQRRSEQPSTSRKQATNKIPLSQGMKLLETFLTKDVNAQKKLSSLSLLGKRKVLAAMDQSMDLSMKVQKMG